MSQFVIESIGHLIGVVPKSGSTMLLNRYHRPGLDALNIECAAMLKRAGWKISAVFRDPIDRLESAYNFFKHGDGKGYLRFGTPSSIREFIDAVLAGLRDRHWIPQYDLYSLNARFLPSACIPLNSFPNVENGTIHVESVDGYRLEELRKFYSSDLSFMRGARIA